MTTSNYKQNIEEALVSRNAISKPEVRAIKNAMSLDTNPKRRQTYQKAISDFQGARDRRANSVKNWRSDIPDINKQIQKNPSQKNYWEMKKKYAQNMARNAARPWIQQNQKALQASSRDSLYKNKNATTMFENLEYKIERLIEEAALISHPAVQEFKQYMKDVSPDEIENDPALKQSALEWLKTHQRDNGLQLSEEEFSKRFQPFFDLGNGDLAMIDYKTNKPVWLAHDDQRFILDLAGKNAVLDNLMNKPGSEGSFEFSKNPSKPATNLK